MQELLSYNEEFSILLLVINIQKFKILKFVHLITTIENKKSQNKSEGEKYNTHIYIHVKSIQDRLNY